MPTKSLASNKQYLYN